MAEHVYRPQHSHIVPPASPPGSVTATTASGPNGGSGSLPLSSGPTTAHAPTPAGPASHGPAPAGTPKIQQFGQKHESVESRWQRPLNKSGTGATHVRTFFGSLSAQGLEFIDRHINEWLDTHPDAEVKFATLQVGDMPTATGREPALIAQVWI